MTQTTLKSFMSPTEFESDSALAFPNYIQSLVSTSSGTINTVAISSEARYIMLNGTADFWMLLSTSSATTATIPSSTVIDGSGSLLVKYQAASARVFYTPYPSWLSVTQSSAV